MLKGLFRKTGSAEQTNDPEKADSGVQISADGGETKTTCGKKLALTCEERQELVDRLTGREHDVFVLLLQGYTLRECAAQLNIKYPTANTHMTGLYKKLRVNSRAELIINYHDIA